MTWSHSGANSRAKGRSLNFASSSACSRAARRAQPGFGTAGIHLFTTRLWIQSWMAVRMTHSRRS